MKNLIRKNTLIFLIMIGMAASPLDAVQPLSSTVTLSSIVNKMEVRIEEEEYIDFKQPISILGDNNYISGSFTQICYDITPYKLAPSEKTFRSKTFLVLLSHVTIKYIKSYPEYISSTDEIKSIAAQFLPQKVQTQIKTRKQKRKDHNLYVLSQDKVFWEFHRSLDRQQQKKVHAALGGILLIPTKDESYLKNLTPRAGYNIALINKAFIRRTIIKALRNEKYDITKLDTPPLNKIKKVEEHTDYQPIPFIDLAYISNIIYASNTGLYCNSFWINYKENIKLASKEVRYKFLSSQKIIKKNLPLIIDLSHYKMRVIFPYTKNIALPYETKKILEKIIQKRKADNLIILNQDNSFWKFHRSLSSQQQNKVNIALGQIALFLIGPDDYKKLTKKEKYDIGLLNATFIRTAIIDVLDNEKYDITKLDIPEDLYMNASQKYWDKQRK